MRFNLKFMAILICSLMFFTSCGGGGDPIGDPTDTSESLSGEESTETDAEGNIITTTTIPAETEPNPFEPQYVKVCFIYNNSVGGDSEIDVFEQARYEVERNQGVETCYIENVLVQQFEDAVQAAKDEGANVIIAASGHFVSACDTMAKTDESETVYINYGGATSAHNKATLRPALYQPANVSGLVAAYNTESNKIGLVIDNNAFHARGIVNAFALGVNEITKTAIELDLKWALSDSYQDTKTAIDKLVSNGADIIFLYQTTEYGIAYCEQIGIKVIGFSQNIPNIAPENYLTGFSFKLDSYITDLVRAKQYDNFTGSKYDGWLKNGMVNMIVLNEKIVKEGTQDISDSLYQLVYDERSIIFQDEIRDNTDTIRVEKGSKLTYDQIFSIDWVIKSIQNIENFSGPRTNDDLFLSNLEVIH